MPILRKAGKGTGFDHHAAEQQPVQEIVFRVFQELRFLLRVEPRQTVQQHLQNFQLVVQKARRIVTVNAIAGEKAVNRAVQTLFSVVQETCVAELTHWVLMAICPASLVFAPCEWTPLFILLYDIGNLPFIVIQRYNRPRMMKILRMREERERA